MVALTAKSGSVRSDRIEYTRGSRHRKTYVIAQKDDRGNWQFFEQDCWELKWYPVAESAEPQCLQELQQLLAETAPTTRLNRNNIVPETAAEILTPVVIV